MEYISVAIACVLLGLVCGMGIYEFANHIDFIEINKDFNKLHAEIKKLQMENEKLQRDKNVNKYHLARYVDENSKLQSMLKNIQKIYDPDYKSLSPPRSPLKRQRQIDLDGWSNDSDSESTD